MTEVDDARSTRLLPHVLEVVAVLAVYAVVGAGCGWLWFQVWPQPVGVVYEGTWYPDEEALRQVFDGTGWYVVIAVAGGVVLGALATVLGRRAPLVTMGAVVVGSLLAAWLMHAVGMQLSPDDPQTLAATARDGTELGGRLSLEDGESAYLAWPFGSLIALMTLNFLLSSRDEIQTRERHDPRWLSRNQPG